MRTAYCPKSHVELSNESAGKPYGHVPGHQYHDVDVVVSRKGDKFRCHVVESWGSAQGYDEEHGRREVIGRGDSIGECVADARDRAGSAGIVCEYLETALSLAEDAAEENVAKPAPNEVLATVDDGDFSDCVNTGYRWTLYGDGRVSAEYHSRWQGSTDGARYVTDEGYVDLDELDPSNPDSDAEALLTKAIADVDPGEDGWQQTRKGQVVK